MDVLCNFMGDTQYGWVWGEWEPFNKKFTFEAVEKFMFV
jgi:hypothetical protein